MAPVLDIENLSTHIKLTSSVVQAVGNVDMRAAAPAITERWPGRKVRAPWTYGAG